MKFITLTAAAFLLATPAPVLAAGGDDNNSTIPDYRTDLFQNCIQGKDIGTLTGVNNPMALLGSINYLGSIMLANGQTGTGWVRQPMALPIITSESTSPDIATCTYVFETVADAGLSIFGFGLSASKNDVYKMTVRLVSRQNIAPVPEGGINLMPWFSNQYKNHFATVIRSIDPTVDKFFIFNDISIYLLQVEKYKKVSGGLLGAFGLVSGGASYKRDESFSGTKIIVTGQEVPLNRAMFATIPGLVAPGVPVAPVVPAGPQNVIQAIDGTQLPTIRANLSF